MKDTDMFNILSKLDNVEKKSKTPLTESADISVDSGTKENPQASMRELLAVMAPTDYSRRLDESESVAKPEGPIKKAMPGTHTMAKNSGTKHPASEFLVGGEEGEVPEEKDEQLDEYDIDEAVSKGRPEGGKKPYMKGTHKMKKDNGKMNSSNKFLVGGEFDEDGQQVNEGDSWGDELVQDLKLLVQEIQEYGMSVEDVVNGINDSIQKYSGDEPSDADGEAEWDSAMGEARGRLQGNDRENDDWEPENDGEAMSPENNPGMYDFGDNEDHLDDDEVGNNPKESVEEEAYDPVRGQFIKQSANPYHAVTEDEIEEDSIAAKQTFADVFKSMDESEEEQTARLEKELFTELDSPELTKADNGKFNLRDGQK